MEGEMLNKLFANDNTKQPIIVGGIAFVALGSALISQYGFDLHPCVLCIYQRVPYYAIVFLAAVALCLRNKNVLKPFLYACALAYLVDAGIAGFHTGVEYKWWEGTDQCGGALANSIEAMRAAIMNAPTARCDEAQFTFILTMAGWNFFYALAGFGYCLLRIRKLKG
jgi:disulfide bond formation protein DsbB